MLRKYVENPALLISVTCGFLVAVFVINIAPQSVSALMDSYGFLEGRAGLVMTVEIMAGAISCTFFAPLLLARFNHHSLVVVGCLSLLFANFGLFLIDSFVGIAILRAIAGVGAGLVLATASATLAVAADPDRLFAQVSLSITIVMTVIILVIADVKSSFGYIGLMIVYSTLILLLAIPLLRNLPAHNTEPEEGQGSLLKAMSGPALFGVSAVFVFTIAEAGVWNFAERAAINRGFSDELIGILLAVSMASGLLGALITIALGKRFGRALPIATGSALIGFCGFATFNPPSDLFLIIAISIINFAFFFVMPFLFGACAVLDKEGRVAAIAAGAQSAGGALGPLFAGFLIELYGYTFLAYTSLALAAACALLGALMDARIRERDALSSIAA